MDYLKASRDQIIAEIRRLKAENERYEEEATRPTSDPPPARPMMLWIVDATGRKWPLPIPAEDDPAKLTLVVPRTQYETGYHGELTPKPHWPEPYWVTSIEATDELRERDREGHVYGLEKTTGALR